MPPEWACAGSPTSDAATLMLRRAYGPEAWLVEHVDPVAFADALVSLDVAGVDEVVPTEATVLVHCERSVHADVGQLLDQMVMRDRAVATPSAVTIEVEYDGEDLTHIAKLTGMPVDEVVDRHERRSYVVAFCGFSPGFAYLRGLDPALHLPRRPTPRTSVPAGSVAIAAGYSSVYPSASPGGWHLLGRTNAVVWDAHRTPPAVLIPGTPVRFRRVGP
jgi:5-oxoprolinase (ATP-hydrolysing) subunit B